MALALGLLSCQESLEKQAERQARKFTMERCPMKLDYLILDSMTFDVSTRTLQRYYRLTGAADHDSLDFTLLRNALIKELRNEPTYRVYREKEFNFYYEYRSDNCPDIVRFTAMLTKDDYR